MMNTSAAVPMQSSGFWSDNWLRWDQYGSPMRPLAEDTEILQRLIRDHAVAAPRAVLLGVTSEIASMRWPDGTRLWSFDRSLGMIQHVWPGSRFAVAVAACADWKRLPIADRSCDVITGDGCFSQLPYPAGYETLARELRRVLKGGGLFAMRAFVQRDPPETAAAVFDDLNAGRIGSFHVFKWRLNMSLQLDLRAGVRLADIWDAWHDAFPEPDTLATKLSWPIEAVRTIDAYREVDACFTYPSLEELRRVLSIHFTETACVYPTYELGERCPTLLFAPR